jgi:hypothetical protein
MPRSVPQEIVIHLGCDLSLYDAGRVHKAVLFVIHNTVLKCVYVRGGDGVPFFVLAKPVTSKKEKLRRQCLFL